MQAACSSARHVAKPAPVHNARRLADCVDFVVCLGGDGVILHASGLFNHNIPPVSAVLVPVLLTRARSSPDHTYDTTVFRICHKG